MEAGVFMEIIAFVFGVFGFVAFVRQQKIIKELKSKGLFDDDYKAD